MSRVRLDINRHKGEDARRRQLLALYDLRGNVEPVAYADETANRLGRVHRVQRGRDHGLQRRAQGRQTQRQRAAASRGATSTVSPLANSATMWPFEDKKRWKSRSITSAAINTLRPTRRPVGMRAPLPTTVMPV